MHTFFSLPFKIDSDINNILLIICSCLILLSCIRLIISKSLIESIIIMSIFSVLISICYLLMDAPDVAMTEVALGASLSTCVLLNLSKVVGEDIGKSSNIRMIFAIILCVVLVAILSWASIDLPEFGVYDSPLQTHLTNYYIEHTQEDISIPSMVAAILASYRGFDTLGETTVILIAGFGVLTIMSRRKRSDA